WKSSRVEGCKQSVPIPGRPRWKIARPGTAHGLTNVIHRFLRFSRFSHSRAPIQSTSYFKEEPVTRHLSLFSQDIYSFCEDWHKAAPTHRFILEESTPFLRGVSFVPTKRPLVLTILDGWGYRAETADNAIALAKKPPYDKLLREYPNTLIQASDHFVGLPDGQMGNSEVGHLNIGAGRIVQMDITRIDALIASGAFYTHPVIVEAMQKARKTQLHLFGLLSDGGVHSHQEHLYALLKMARENKVEKVFVHCFTDGRDTPPESGIDFLRQLQQKMREYGAGQIASISGRYYAMDRDNRWERVEKAYRAMVHGDAESKFDDPIAAVRASYEKGVTDEFVVPAVITTQAAAGKSAAPRGVIRDDDAVIFFNYRADRARQMTRALVEPGFKEFSDPKRPPHLVYVGMTQYEKSWPWLKYLIAPEKLEHILANVFAELQYKNLRVAET